MDFSSCRPLRCFRLHLDYPACKCLILVAIVLVFRAVCLPSYSGFGGIGQSNLLAFSNRKSASNSEHHSGKFKFLEVPQIVWGLNNQKIAFARACLTARMLNRTLLMPSLSASLFYKEVDLLKPISFDKQASEYETIRIVGKNPFLWHDHWPVEDYAKVFQCLVWDDKISREADKVVSKIREIGLEESRKVGSSQNEINLLQVPYVAVHMRIEKDWMIHCKKLEQRLNISEICSSKEQIMQRVGNIVGLKTPIVIYLAVADDLLEDNSILTGWNEGLLPLEKKRLGVFSIYKKHSYLIQSAIDYEVCLRSDVFVGNSFSTFSSLVVLERTQKMITMGVKDLCGTDVRWPSYAYNLEGELNGPHPWATNMSDLSLQAISYGSNHISCG
ncbi:UNVERIFIED_CONTAM: O-fucosyltransferase 23 [Sesamum radiatum]|uniref:O-fucosyltransferase family protein n=1 Tax=Sesamum radiatum TaxID=300843 RepID=A0AAW2T3G1_SESRA